MNGIRNPRVQTHSTYLFLKLLALLWCECVCFGNKWNDIHFFMQTLHKLNIQWFKSEIHNIKYDWIDQFGRIDSSHPNVKLHTLELLYLLIRNTR